VEIISIILLLVFAVIVSGIVSRILPLPLPRPLFQIAIGAAIGMIADWQVTLDPELFFALFLPPPLPRRMAHSARGVVQDGKTVLELALGLVIFTVAGMGLLINWMIPSMPLPVAFALAAVLSPTDPIAVSAIAQRSPIPKRMMHILEGESLLNDASGLVCLRFAIAAALTGAFSIQAAFLNFLWVAIGGVAIGAGMTWAIGKAKSWISRGSAPRTGHRS
jgi:CPA1 family monovalent cation:H+ antiporter